ncbi:hypothetical protein, partial [Sphingorhabdus lacus]|uniref:hypothetical protein n=1 Tax=Sphingorhabdus lacus TaxID=392610 RepID=UPI0035930912
EGSNDRPSNIGACNTANSPPNINPTDEANAPLIYAAISAKCSDDGHQSVFRDWTMQAHCAHAAIWDFWSLCMSSSSPVEFLNLNVHSSKR